MRGTHAKSMGRGSRLPALRQGKDPANIRIRWIMEVLQAIKERRSVRRFKNSPVESSKIELLKEALIWAPSAGNLQKRRFYFVYNDKIKEKLVLAALDQDFIREAPLAVVGCADMTIKRHYMERGARLYAIQDVS